MQHDDIEVYRWQCAHRHLKMSMAVLVPSRLISQPWVAFFCWWRFQARHRSVAITTAKNADIEKRLLTVTIYRSKGQFESCVQYRRRLIASLLWHRTGLWNIGVGLRVAGTSQRASSGQFGPVRTSSDQFGPVRTSSDQFGLVQPVLNGPVLNVESWNHGVTNTESTYVDSWVIHGK